MLPSTARLRSSRDFATTTRQGQRAGAASMVTYLHRTDATSGPRIGFVVGRRVGSSVVRHRVVRQLRHLMRDRLAGLPAGADVVVRALPAAAAASSARLGRDLDHCLDRVTRP